MSKKHAVAQRKAQRTSLTPELAKVSASAANAKQTAQPGIIAAIMEQLTIAKQKKHPVTSAQIGEFLAKRFPTRAPAGMMITVRAQLSRLPSEKDFKIARKKEGRVVTYAAA